MKIIIPALAATLAITTANPAAAQTQGFHVEATTGYDVLTSKDNLTGPADVIPDTLKGLRLGISGGYDIAIAPRIVVGLEAGIGATVTGDAVSRFAGNTLTLGAGRDLDVGVRVGFAVGPRTLVYGKVGYANSRSNAELREPLGSSFETTKYAGNGSGVRWGGGIEQVIGSRKFVKVEYRQTRYNDGSIEYQQRTRRHQILLGFGTRF